MIYGASPGPRQGINKAKIAPIVGAADHPAQLDKGIERLCASNPILRCNVHTTSALCDTDCRFCCKSHAVPGSLSLSVNSRRVAGSAHSLRNLSSGSRATRQFITEEEEAERVSRAAVFCVGGRQDPDTYKADQREAPRRTREQPPGQRTAKKAAKERLAHLRALHAARFAPDLGFRKPQLAAARVRRSGPSLICLDTHTAHAPKRMPAHACHEEGAKRRRQRPAENSSPEENTGNPGSGDRAPSQTCLKALLVRSMLVVARGNAHFECYRTF